LNDSLKNDILDWIKDIVIAAVVIGVIMGALYAYTGTWPPMVVVESESMQHSDDTSHIGVIDTGDIVLSKHVNSMSEITTYVEGRASGYKTYGDYGDVIIYEPYGRQVTPIIHRAVIYLVWNNSTGGYDAPGLKNLKYGEDYRVSGGDQWRNIHGTITIMDYGYAHKDLNIPINVILLNERHPHSGYITAGDHNIAKDYGVDQPGICREPVEFRWIVGKAEGELPWFGIIKLMFSGTLSAHPAPMNSWIMLTISIALLFFIPWVTDIVYDHWKEKRKKGENEEENDAEHEDYGENGGAGGYFQEDEPLEEMGEMEETNMYEEKDDGSEDIPVF
jgi:signal peptidase